MPVGGSSRSTPSSSPATLRACIVTQAIAEAVYNYNGIGTLVVYIFSVGGANVAGFDQVAIFLLAAVVLASTLTAT